MPSIPRALSAICAPLLVACWATCGPAAAQATFYTLSSSPNPSNVGQSLPFRDFGATSCLSQMVVSRFLFQNAPVNITGLAFGFSDMGVMRFQRIKIRMGTTAINWLPATMSTNRPAQTTTVLDTGAHLWNTHVNEWCDIGLQAPYTYVPSAGNLFIEFEITGASIEVGGNLYVYRTANSSPVGNLVAAGYNGTVLPTTATTNGDMISIRISESVANASYFGDGCAGTGGRTSALGFSGGSGALGGTASVWLSNAPPQALALLGIALGGSVPGAPISLTSFGMPNCLQYVSPTVTGAVTTSTLGMAAYPIAIPNVVALAGTLLTMQYLVNDPGANAANLTTTNYGRLLIGY